RSGFDSILEAREKICSIKSLEMVLVENRYFCIISVPFSEKSKEQLSYKRFDGLVKICKIM
ncbi:MAG: hypothetical protein KAS47_01760, partial [Candidatus Heimdallarchaeota archaeon]|nr:hypothetical protein [Candidatus Heimdallarchaeota archaeon]